MVTPVHRALGEKGRYKSRMFDFFVKNRLSPQELAAFIAVALGCPAENVLVVTSSELQDIRRWSSTPCAACACTGM